MLPAPAKLYICPNCHKSKAMRSLLSGNTCDGELWSDNRAIYPMCPRLSIIQKCPQCGKYSLLEQWEETDKTDSQQPDTTGTFSFAESKEAYIQFRDSPTMDGLTYQTALYFVQAYNDEFCRPKIREAIYKERFTQIASGSYPSPTDDDIKLFLEATQHVIDFSDMAQETQILKADLHRERGEWIEAYEILHGMQAGKNQWIVDTILYYTCNRDASLIPFVMGGQKIDYNCTDVQTLPIPEDPEVLDERQKNIDQYLKDIPSERVKDIFADTLGGIYDKSTNTLLKIVSPSFRKYNVRNGISHIGDYAVYRNEYINKIQFTPDMRTIGVKAFYNCNNLAAIMASDADIQVIGDCAFMNCKSLTDIQFIDNVKYLGRSVFAGMENLRSIVLPENIDSIPEFTFCGCTSLEYIYIPPSIRRIETCSLYHTAITELDMPDTVEAFGEAAFSRCFNLESVKLSSKLAIIPQRAFDSCTSLHCIDIPRNVKEIRTGAFENTPSLKCVHFHGKIETISESAFKNSGLQKIIVPFWTKSLYRRLFPNTKIEIRYF